MKAGARSYTSRFSSTSPPAPKGRGFAFIWQRSESACQPAISAPDMTTGVFVMLFKNKGSSDDCSKYRMICLLPHAYKMLSTHAIHSAVTSTAIQM